MCVPRLLLAVFDRKRYLLSAPAKSGAGIGTLRNVTGDIRRAPRLFLCRALGYTSMVGLAGAPQGAPVACNAGSSNPVQSTTMRLEPLVVGFKPVTGGCHYGYYPNPNSPVTHRSVQRRHGFHRPCRLLRSLC
ncbi:TPA: ash family protein [Klebsiella pneumoniae]|uniref:ash family protein n=1 Tax=Klebsiella pneumoniae TaxID=573 RepID=UPI00115904C8|nr:ash family protein [Klebsiella pneumoniae]HBR2161329.1 ash family protein [Klebsiella pneumoniae]HBT4710552.1 ash family protein [Klebsiella pneumoniae]HBT4781767.1 ash family protein [Klebsiella pneumoniae]HDS4015643.1 ash family protein [Klebsiella pneumoniae]